jgi:hypothetical protein
MRTKPQTFTTVPVLALLSDQKAANVHPHQQVKDFRMGGFMPGRAVGNHNLYYSYFHSLFYAAIIVLHQHHYDSIPVSCCDNLQNDDEPSH